MSSVYTDHAIICMRLAAVLLVQSVVCCNKLKRSQAFEEVVLFKMHKNACVDSSDILNIEVRGSSPPAFILLIHHAIHTQAA